ncbi:hypothetical protein ACFT7S_13240 [Streptomyces sp. NPDC057136]|uniref:hypothetical protein n=1 Tax=Streptomyces sp. NPDC057136 TaxID=3346029 RepID=UPI00362E0AA8
MSGKTFIVDEAHSYAPWNPPGGAALVVCNTVGDAQETKLLLRERFDKRSHAEGGQVHLLHGKNTA